MDIAINYLAVVVAAVVAFLFGWAWHSPLLFMKQWMKLMGYKDMDEAGRGAVVSVSTGMMLGALLMLVESFVLAHFVVLINVTSWDTALQLAFWAWLGFMVPILMGQVLWEKRSWALFGFNAAYHGITLAIMAVILGVWPR